MPLSPIVIAGLGNPGPRYALTRHNIGFMAVDRFAANQRVESWLERSDALIAEVNSGDRELTLVKPLTYMNRSGRVLAALVNEGAANADAMVVVHDDLDLPFGKLRIREGGGHGGHNGIRSIIEELGVADFIRLIP